MTSERWKHLMDFAEKEGSPYEPRSTGLSNTLAHCLKEALAEIKPAEIRPEQDGVKVRIAYAQCEGAWAAVGRNQNTDANSEADAVYMIQGCGKGRISTGFILCTLPLPKAVEVQGRVEPEK